MMAVRLFHHDCIAAFRRSGFKMHDVVIVKVRSPHIRVSARQHAASRITGKIHEYLLVARKEAKVA